MQFSPEQYPNVNGETPLLDKVISANEFGQTDGGCVVDSEIGAGSVTVVLTVVVQPFASVTVKVYEPATNPDCEGLIV